MDKNLYQNYVTILKHELMPALGCTEPIAIAYCAAVAKSTLGKIPEHVEICCSGNIIKNVKGVTVPNSNGMKGIEAAAALGITGGDPKCTLEVLKNVTEEDREAAEQLLRSGACTVSLMTGEENLYICCRLQEGEDRVLVELKTNHDHISRIEKNGQVLFSQPDPITQESGDKSLMDMESIYAFANACDLGDVREVLERQAKMNWALAEEGLRGNWGANVGSTYRYLSSDDVRTRAIAMAAAGSDARMSGCALPAVINSGSGNQGITVTVPLLVYAENLRISHEKTLRALALANLISIHQKRFIGNLSCYCGAVSAATAAACGIAYLSGDPYAVICNTVVNAVATIGGMICDGAKPSCAAKIRTALENALFALELARKKLVFRDGEGIVGKDVEATIQNIGRVGRIGMASTDIEVLNIMIGK